MPPSRAGNFGGRARKPARYRAEAPTRARSATTPGDNPIPTLLVGCRSRRLSGSPPSYTCGQAQPRARSAAIDWRDHLSPIVGAFPQIGSPRRLVCGITPTIGIGGQYTDIPTHGAVSATLQSVIGRLPTVGLEATDLLAGRALAFPGFAGYRRTSLPAPRRGRGRDGLPSSQNSPPPVPCPIRRRVLQRPLLDPRRLPWPSPRTNRLGTLSSVPKDEAVTTLAQASLTLRAGRSHPPRFAPNLSITHGA